MGETAELPGFDPRPTQCAGLVEAAATSMRIAAERKGVSLHFEAAEIDLVVRVDRLALSRRVLALIDDAIEATQHGRILVGVARKLRDGRSLVEISVAGAGGTETLLLPEG